MVHQSPLVTNSTSTVTTVLAACCSGSFVVVISHQSHHATRGQVVTEAICYLGRLYQIQDTDTLKTVYLCHCHRLVSCDVCHSLTQINKGLCIYMCNCVCVLTVCVLYRTVYLHVYCIGLCICMCTVCVLCICVTTIATSNVTV